MSVIEDVAVAPTGNLTSGAAPQGWRWIGHVLVLALILLAIARWLGDGVYTIDENAYRTQAAQLVDEGRWGVPTVAGPDAVPSLYAPLALSDVQPTQWFPYARHAAYPAALVALDPLAPGGGGLLLSGIALLVIAVAAGLLTERRGRVDGRIGFWVAATASPFLIHANIGWAHLPAAAALVVAFSAIDDRSGWSVRRAAVVVVGVMIAVLFRTEALLACGALVAAVAIDRRSSAERVRWATTIAISTVVAFGVDRLLFRWATGSIALAPTGTDRGDGDLVVERLQAMIALVFDVGGTTPQHVARLMAALLLVGASLLIRHRRDPGMVAVLVILGAVLGIYGALQGDSYPGLLAAWPLLVPALVLSGQEPSAKDSTRRFALTFASGFWILLLAVAPADGGGLGWGARLALVALPVVVPVVASALARANATGRAVLVVALALSTLVSGAGLQRVADARASSVVVQGHVADALTPFLGTDQVLISTDRRLGRMAPALAVQLPLQSLPDDTNLESFLRVVEQAGILHVTHIDLFDNDTPRLPEGWTAGEPRFDETVRVVVLERESP